MVDVVPHLLSHLHQVVPEVVVNGHCVLGVGEYDGRAALVVFDQLHHRVLSRHHLFTGDLFSLGALVLYRAH